MVADHKETNITLRPVTDEDREFLLEVYAAGREIELSAVPWDEAMKRAFVEHQFTAQDAYYRQEYPSSTHEIVLFDGEPAGRIYLDRSVTEISILDMAVIPQFRRRGIATTLVKRLQDEGQISQRSIRIYLETFNPAISLFIKLSFQESSSDGISHRFDWFPDK
ncbi:MAG: GNAT family N-acetyltransferase [Acidobacteria bacterium]|nr:GNAT family N-acetyltransferase [Acidobacteriota bacterium]